MKFNRLYNLLLEGRKESEQLLLKHFPADTNLREYLLDLDQTTSKGDIPNIIKLYKSNPNKNIEVFSRYINKYYEFKNKNIKINLVPDFVKFTEIIDAEEYKQSNKLKKKDNSTVQIEEGQDENKIAEDNELVIYKAHSQNTCVKYGQGYSFCISRQSGGNMYSNYRLGKSSTFYFIFFKNVPKSDNKHIMVLDRTQHGWEWTFANNNTQQITWDRIINEFPVLKKYEHLFVNVPLTDKERRKINDIQNFQSNKSLELFKTFDLETRIDILKSGDTIPDKIFDTLSKELINEYISVGPNLTNHQVKKLPKNFIPYYQKRREISIPQLLENGIYERNIYDNGTQIIQDKIKEEYEKVETLISEYMGGDFRITQLKFLISLPESIGNMRIDGNFICSYNQLTSLPESIGNMRINGSFHCSDNQLTSLPESIGNMRINGSFICYDNQLTSLPESIGNMKIGGDFYCSYNQSTSLPESIGNMKIGGSFDCSNNQLTSLPDSIGDMKIGRDFNCSNNQLKSLPRSIGNIKIGRDFYCHNNQLKYLPKSVGDMKIGGDFDYSDNKIKNYIKPTEHSLEMKEWAKQFKEELKNEIKDNNLNLESFKEFFYHYYG
jgi:hypothetical protein